MIRIGLISRAILPLKKNNLHSLCRPSTFIRSAPFSTYKVLYKEYKSPNNFQKQKDSAKSLITKSQEIRQKQKDSTKQLIAKTQAYQQALQSTTKKNIETILPKHENIYTIPNMLTMTRLVSAPVIGYLLCHNETAWAMSLFAYSCITDFVDGYIARKYNMGSVLGSIIDPAADKLLMTICTVSLCYNLTMPTYLAALIIGRDVMLGFMALYYRFVTLPKPRSFLKYVDLLIPTASVHPTKLSKWNTGFQMIYIGTLVLKPGIELMLGTSEWVDALHYFLTGFEYLVASTTLISGGTYLFSKNAIKVIKK